MPGFIASRVVALAAELSWSEEDIVHRLSFPRGEQYYHGLLLRAGWKTYAPPESPDKQMEALDEAEKHAEPFMEPSPEMQALFEKWNL